MKKTIHQYMLWMLICSGMSFQMYAQSDALNFKEPDVRKLPFGSYLKGIYTFQRDDAGGLFLYHDAVTSEGTLAPFDASDEGFYFWVVENLFGNYFQLYSTAVKDQLAVPGVSGVPVFLDTEDNSEASSRAGSRLVFRMPASGPSTTQTDKEEGIVAKGYITTISGVSYGPSCGCNILNPGQEAAPRFVVKKIDYSVEYPVTFEKAEAGNANGTIEEDVVNRWTTLTQVANGGKNNFVSSKFFVGGFGPDDFKVTIEQGTEGTIGFTSYLYHEYTPAVHQRALPKVGLKVHQGRIFLVFANGGQQLPTSSSALLGETVVTNFVFGEPITLGFEGQKYLTATQGSSTFKVKLLEPTGFFLNQSVTHSGRMLASLEEGKVKVSYSLKNRLVNLREDFGSADGTGFHSSDAFFPYASGDSIVNTFDWTQTRWRVRYQDNVVYSDSVFSPFYLSGSYYNGISARFSPATGGYLGGEDYSHTEGWELMKADLGYNADGSVRSQAPQFPYVIFYDRIAGVLRVMVYINNEGEANQLIIGFHTANNTVYEPRMWGGMAQFAALNQVIPGRFSQPVTFYSTPGRKWYFADFITEFDPCVCFFESNFTLEVYKETQGDLSIIGRLSGGSIPAGTDAYDGWADHREEYLMGVMGTDFGSLENTLGTTVFNQFDEFDMVDYSDAISGALVGADIEQWQKDQARLEWEAAKQEGDAVISRGRFQIVEGAATMVAGYAHMGYGIPFLNIGSNTLEAGAIIAQGAAKIGQGGALIAQGDAKLKSASAQKLYYDAIKDKDREDDQDINLTAPPPRPHVVFGDLALKGKLKIKTSLLGDDARLVTPGGQDPCTGKNCEWYQNGMLGSRPLYRQPLGNFNLLEQPEFGVAITDNGSEAKAYLKIKEKPYFVHNNSAAGKIDDVLSVIINVQTHEQFDNDGETAYRSAGNASPAQGYTTLIGQPGGLVGAHDISRLIDWEVIRSNMEQLDSGQNIAAHLSDWVTVSYEVWSLTMSNLKARNQSRAFANRNVLYEGETVFAYETSTTNGSQLYEDAQDLASSHQVISGYDFSDDERFGNHYNLYYTDFKAPGDPMYAGMSSYCQGLQSASAARIAERVAAEEMAELEGPGFVAYPNPAEHTVYFDLSAEEEGEVQLALYDLEGRLLVHTTDQLYEGYSLRGEINVQPLAPGIYILKAVLSNGRSIERKIIRK